MGMLDIGMLDMGMLDMGMLVLYIWLLDILVPVMLVLDEEVTSLTRPTPEVIVSLIT